MIKMPDPYSICLDCDTILSFGELECNECYSSNIKDMDEIEIEEKYSLDNQDEYEERNKSEFY